MGGMGGMGGMGKLAVGTMVASQTGTALTQSGTNIATVVLQNTGKGGENGVESAPVEEGSSADGAEGAGGDGESASTDGMSNNSAGPSSAPTNQKAAKMPAAA
uniref:Uncharacterized protein n=1 Tax=Rhipicephalus zambeziensis TaxID=60191 RepID=A0A224YHD7_9ACAR